MARKRRVVQRSDQRRVDLVVVVVFALLLLAQGYYSFRVDPEPYPVIRMPGFGNAASSEGTRTVTLVEGTVDFSDGTSSDINPMSVMETIRFSTARPTLNFAFGPQRSHHWSPEVVAWLRERVETVTGRTDASIVRFCWQHATVHIEDANVTDDGACKWTEIPL